MRKDNADEDKLLRVVNSPWFTWGMTLFWALFVYSDYRYHRFSWVDGLLVGAFGLRGLAEVMIVLYRHRKNAARKELEKQ